MKKLFGIIAVLFFAAGVATAQDGGKKADQSAVSATKQTGTNCDMKNFCCMRAGRMTMIKDGQEVGMATDMKLKSGANIKTDGTLTDAKGTTVTLKEGEAIDMDGNRCKMTAVHVTEPAAVPAEVK